MIYLTVKTYQASNEKVSTNFKVKEFQNYEIEKLSLVSKQDKKFGRITFISSEIAKKAKELGMDAIILADDSGLVVDALNGEPGIYSARYLGEDTSYAIKNANIIERLEGVPDEKRTARFVCAIAAVFPDGSEKCSEATYEGIIGYEEKGKNGFGYDPILYLPDRGCYSAELDMDEKNRISHRGKALEAMKLQLKELM